MVRFPEVGRFVELCIDFGGVSLVYSAFVVFKCISGISYRLSYINVLYLLFIWIV